MHRSLPSPRDRLVRPASLGSGWFASVMLAAAWAGAAEVPVPESAAAPRSPPISGVTSAPGE